eukprot:CAMPEP_0114545348 /NCGR_PEP_ID=MMETSP0114-20121206/3351_1 /TAXON_ID=31324 /ORGANISM="Goniomonas sp, Strain m" /LENGTH=176 /DNA_ID=CAMNT_0001729767 /DNA_START=120 /DNA_END=650 /DNA_ORIENTATION=-
MAGDKFDFSVRWWPFQLNPSAPQRVNKMQMYTEKFGADRCRQMLPYMLATGKADGINFSYGGDTGNTFDSHRLIHLAQKQGKEDACVEELFKNYFEEEKNMADRSVLLAAASKVGLEGAEAYLDSEDGTREVQQEMQTKARNVTGVPYFIITGSKSFELSGAQTPDVFLNIFEKLK